MNEPRVSRPRSQAIFSQGEEILVGGVNSPVRAFHAVGGQPIIVDHAQGARVFDADGNEYLDYVCSWGALILGHAHPAVTAAIQEQAARGTSYGMTTALEVELARRIRKALPSMEMVRFVSSGTEATMSAIRLARAFTRREFILKFEGCYHGHADSFLSQAGSGLATLGIASSHGVPEQLAALTLNATYNDIASVERLFAKYAGQIAAVIVEPVAANMGVVPPEGSFLDDLRELSRQHGTLLIFDEVITGFRLAYGGAQTKFNIEPDLTTLGKIIGGGLPVAAYGGRRDIMRLVSPLGPVYQAGTLSGNPLAMRAGIETLRQLEIPGSYDALEKKTARLARGLRDTLREARLPATVAAVGSLLTLFFTAEPVRDFKGAQKSDTRRFAAYFTQMLKRGILLPPSQFEALFLSAAHTDLDIDRTIGACRDSLEAILAHAPTD